MQETKIRIALIDDHALFRKSLKRIIELDPVFSVVQTAENSKEALEILDQGEEIDICIIDWDLSAQSAKIPDSYPKTGLELGNKILQEYKRTKVILITGMDFDKVGLIIRKSLDFGIQGFLLKDCDEKDVYDAIKTVSQGSLYYRGKVMDLMGMHVNMQRDIHILKPVYLNSEEIEVLQYIADGKSNEMIAKIKNCGIGAIENRRTKIKHKLHAENLFHAISIAYKRGILSIYDRVY